MTSGYSATPQAAKLGIKPGCRLVIDAAPLEWRLDDPPPLAWVTAGDAADVVLAFVRAESELAPAVRRWQDVIRPAGALWIAWPRRASGHVSDLSENAIRDCVLPLGLVDVKVAAIDPDWSGLKIVWRRENR